MLLKLLVVLVLQLSGILFFGLGFFPQKNVISGNAIFHFNNTLQKDTKPVFNKLVLVVIDALRSDFIFDKYNSQFHFVHSKLNSGEAWGFTAFSNPPTVTLPRLKGITTGSTPNFLDAILNVAEDDSSSSIKDQDSWLSQLHINANHKIRFFGDDTWLKLFAPVEDIFDSWEGTNSFFVSDFKEVDHNVTRHIQRQIDERDQWDTLILHYLGLDHIGHKGGPSSKFMPDKQLEMDDIIHKLYDNIIDDESLLVVIGDHGMNDVGNHGGSSAGETHAGTVFLSPKLSQIPPPRNGMAPFETPLNDDKENTFEYMNQIQQIDLVPTLAALFNVPIPQNSVGIIIPEFLSFLDDKMKNIKIWENLRQLTILDNNQLPNINTSLTMTESYTKMKDIQQSLTRSATNYGYNKLGIGYGFLIISTVLVSAIILKELAFSFTTVMTIMISIIVGCSTFGSSFVEEEHQIWWWVITGSLLLTFVLKNKEMKSYLSCFILFICVRLIRGWNNTGQKTVYSYVIRNLLDKTTDIQWILNIIAVFGIGFSTEITYLSLLDTVIIPILIFSYKLNWAIVDKEEVPVCLQQVVRHIAEYIFDLEGEDIFIDSLIPMARLFYKMFFAVIILRISLILTKNMERKSFVKGMFKDIAHFLIFLSPSENIPQFLLYDLIKRCITQLICDEYDCNIYLTTIVSLVLQNFCFFQFGGTNSIATIDLSNAYHGISANYNIYLVGWLMTVSNFAPAIYWILFTWEFIYSNKSIYQNKNKWNLFAKSKLPSLFFYSIVGCCLMASCVILRYHLFIWSVFSPKLCYYVVWNLVIGVIIGWILELLLISIL